MSKVRKILYLILLSCVLTNQENVPTSSVDTPIQPKTNSPEPSNIVVPPVPPLVKPAPSSTPKTLNVSSSSDVLPKTQPLIQATGTKISEAEYMAPYDVNLPREDGKREPAKKLVASAGLYDYQNYDSLKSRYEPQEKPSTSQYNPYVIPEARLKELRSEFMYWFFDKGGPENQGDYQNHIQSSNPQVHKNFNFQLPFFGFRFNYTRVSVNGYLEFSDPPDHYTYPLTFPVKEWPKKRDPAFIGIFFSKCRIGKIRDDDIDQRAAGVYFRLERDLHARTDKFGVEVRERLMWDIREGVIGASTFIPKHAVIVTWKNVSFAGGIDNSLYKTNTFQLILATDEVYGYAIFNYKELTWTSHTEAGGDTTTGEGGVPAFIGFNAGNGTRSYEYKPYSQASVIRDLSGRGWANGFQGRHIFRIDENIMMGTCNKDIAGVNLPLVFAPESGNMLGGTVVNITGPCFELGERIRCRFDTEDVIGTVVDTNRAICVQPFLQAEGYVRFEISTSTSGDNKFNWKGKFFVETPATATERIRFETSDVHEKAPAEIKLTWDKYNLTSNSGATVKISLWGYKETTIRPQLMYIDSLEESILNSGSHILNPSNYDLRDNGLELQELRVGFIQINLTNSETYSGLKVTPVIWSKPIPLGWYFNAQWERKHGKDWPDELCNTWLRHDRFLKNYANELYVCPCTLEHALVDKGRFMPDPNCDKDANPDCFYHKGAVHCVITGSPSLEGSEQQCCYDKNGYLMMSYDQQWGSRPRRSHNLGILPWNEANKVPTLSQWYHDISPFYYCCLWQEEQSVGCETMRFERRPTQDCVAYQSPAIGTIFGDPHLITFDNVEYTFNGKGEFVLVHADSNVHKINVQARFEQVSDNIYGEVAATQLTAIAAQDNSSAIIEVRLRPPYAQWRYHLDVLSNGKRIYFDRSSLRVQHFPGVTVYTPPYILNQSEIIIMFQSGAGVEVVENKGFMSARVYLPWSYINQTRGLLGNFSFDVLDDFTLPDGNIAGVTSGLNNFERIHKDFAIHWMLEEREEANKFGSLFSRENGRLSSFYSNKSFVPEYRGNINDIVPPNRTQEINRANAFCGESYQCKYDYVMSLNTEMAHYTLNYHTTHTELKKITDRVIKTCGVLETPRYGRKSNFFFTPGTKVLFECNEDFHLIGDARRICTPDGHWDFPEYGYTECLRAVEYEQRVGWKTVGILAGIFALIIIVVGLILYKLCYKKNDIASNKSWNFLRNNSLNASQIRSVSELQPYQTDDHRKLYDKVYRTNEPLQGKPLIEFSEDQEPLDLITDEDFKKVRDSMFENEGPFNLRTSKRPKTSMSSSESSGVHYDTKSSSKQSTPIQKSVVKEELTPPETKKDAVPVYAIPMKKKATTSSDSSPEVPQKAIKVVPTMTKQKQAISSDTTDDEVFTPSLKDKDNKSNKIGQVLSKFAPKATISSPSLSSERSEQSVGSAIQTAV